MIILKFILIKNKYRNYISINFHIITYPQMELLRYSAPFKFQNECIEYCIGLVVEQDRIICTYSAWDRSTIIGIYNKKYIDDIIENKI